MVPHLLMIPIPRLFARNGSLFPYFIFYTVFRQINVLNAYNPCPYSQIIQPDPPFVNKTELFISEPVRFRQYDYSNDLFPFCPARFLYKTSKFS